jgi:hypothetical protein
VLEALSRTVKELTWGEKYVAANLQKNHTNNNNRWSLSIVLQTRRGRRRADVFFVHLGRILSTIT